MTPSQIETACRQRINAVNDTLWSSAEIMNYLYFAMMEFVMDVRCTETSYSTTSVVSQSTYARPTGAMEIKRITYDGYKLQEIDQRQYDSLNGGFSSAQTGRAQYYWIFQDLINLYPVPDTAALTIAIQGYAEPTIPTASSTLEIPTVYHWGLIEGTLYHMTTKEVGDPRSPLFEAKWNRAKAICLLHNNRKRRSDGFTRTKREEDMVQTYLGMV